MKQMLCLSIAAVFLFGASVVHGQDVGILRAVDCASITAISFEIEIPDIAQWDSGVTADVDAWALNSKADASCKPTFNQGSGRVVYAAFDVQVCGNAPTISADTTQLEYAFSINVVSDDTPVTYEYDHQYTVTCLYNREQQNLQASFEPRHSLSDTSADEGTLLITLSLHNFVGDAELSGIIDLSTPIYGKALVVADGFPNLDVHFVSVTTTPDGDVNNAGAVTLVTDGCEDANGIVNNVECDTNEDDKFFMDTNGAFRFPSQADGELVYFHATVTVCLSGNAASTCQAQCTACPAKRKRRETVKDALQTTYYVKAGPYRIVDSDSKKAAAVDKDEGAAFPTYAIAVVAVCGVVAIAVVSAVVVIVLRRRRQNTTITEPRDTGVTA